MFVQAASHLLYMLITHIHAIEVFVLHFIDVADGKLDVFEQKFGAKRSPWILLLLVSCLQSFVHVLVVLRMPP